MAKKDESKPFRLAKVREGGRLVALQLRRGTGGPGNSWYFGVNLYGSEEGARTAAQAMVKAHAGVFTAGLTGCKKKDTPSDVPGIALKWKRLETGRVHGYVVVTWRERKGGDSGKSKCKSTRSCERHGIEACARWAAELRQSKTGIGVDAHKLQMNMVEWYRAGAGKAKGARSR